MKQTNFYSKDSPKNGNLILFTLLILLMIPFSCTKDTDILKQSDDKIQNEKRQRIHENLGGWTICEVSNLQIFIPECLNAENEPIWNAGILAAINNYNNVQGSAINFVVTANEANADIVLSCYSNDDCDGGFVGEDFVNTGNSNTLALNTGLDLTNCDCDFFGLDICSATHIVMHELAHTLGFFHNNSTHQNSIHIDGTPDNDDPNSIINGGDIADWCNMPCEFSEFDIIALETIYPSMTSNDIWTQAGDGDLGWHIGDFDGDDKDDIFRYMGGSCGAEVFLSTGSQFNFDDCWTTAGVDSKGWHIGNFDGIGGDDIFRYKAGSCGAEMFRSTGSEFEFNECWTTAGDGNKGWHIGDFDGDDKDDIFRYMRGSCGAEMFLSTGSEFEFKECWTTAGDGDRGWLIGNFDGIGGDDIFRYMGGSCGAEMFLSNGSGFDFDGCWTTAGDGDKGWHVGDFDGDGKDDIFRYIGGSCGAEMFRSTGSGFEFDECWTLAGDGDKGWHIGNFNGDGVGGEEGKDDIFRYKGCYYGADVFLSTGNSF